MTASFVTVVCDGFYGSGSAITHGTAWFSPSVTLTDVPDGMFVPQGPVPAEFRSRVSPTVSLLATDDANVQPSGWAWGVQFAYIPGNPASYNFFLPAGPASFAAAAGTPCVLGWGTTTALTSLPDGTGVQLSGGSVPSAFSTAATYYVVNPSGTTVSLATSRGGSAIASASAGSGDLTVVQYNLSALSPVGTAVTMQAYLPLPSGTPQAGQVPVASGAGEASAWGTPSGGSGTVTSVAVESANGFAGTVADATSTPQITLETTVTGILKGNGTAVSAATAGTDYLAPNGSGAALTGITAAQVGADASGAAATAQSNAEAASLSLANGGTVAGPVAFTSTATAETPTQSTQIANKAYVDSVAAGLDAKPSVTALAASNITLSGTQTIDGVAVTAGERVLCTSQSTSSQNGLWVVASGSWTRPTDFASGSTQLGAFAFVEAGTAYGSSGWVLVGASAVTVDTSAQTWTQFSGAGEINAGTGLSKSGNTLSVTPSTYDAYGAAATAQANAEAASVPLSDLPLSIPNGGTGAAAAAQNAVFAGPASGGTGAPSYRALVAADLPAATTSAQGAVILDGTATDIQPTGTRAAGSTGKAADAGHVHSSSGMYLCTPTSYAPGTQTVLSTSSETFAAVSSASVNTGSFTAPPSGSVVVTASFVDEPSASGVYAAFGLCAHGTVTPLVCPTVEIKTTGDYLAEKLTFLVTGLTPGTSYNFDLVFATNGTMEILALGQTGTTITAANGSCGAPVIMTVQAV
jgi:hypothetical protein